MRDVWLIQQQDCLASTTLLLHKAHMLLEAEPGMQAMMERCLDYKCKNIIIFSVSGPAQGSSGRMGHAVGGPARQAALPWQGILYGCLYRTAAWQRSLRSVYAWLHCGSIGLGLCSTSPPPSC
jgi:hypothetical protein